MNSKIAAILKAVLAIVVLAVALCALPMAQAQEKKPAEAAEANPIIFSGKVYCSLVRPVALPFHGIITELEVRAGQKVSKGEPLASYRLSPQTALLLTKRLDQSGINELLVLLAEAELGVDEARLKLTQVEKLSGQDLAPPEGLKRARRALSLVQRQRRALASQVDKVRALAKQDQALLAKMLGSTAEPGQVPETAAMVSPIDGYVIWVHPELRPGAEMKPTTPAMLVGVMQPMLVRSLVHEIEALKLTLGDRAEVRVESLPGKVFQARVSRISWSPVTLDPLKPSYYEVELTLGNPKLELKMGLKAQVTLTPKR